MCGVGGVGRAAAGNASFPTLKGSSLSLGVNTGCGWPSYLLLGAGMKNFVNTSLLVLTWCQFVFGKFAMPMGAMPRYAATVLLLLALKDAV